MSDPVHSRGSVAWHSAAATGCCSHGEHEGAEALVIDPVCGMQVDPADAEWRAEHHGRTYWFCCDGCRDMFLADPERYLAPKMTSVPQPASGAGHNHHGHGDATPAEPRIAATAIGPATDPVCGMKVDPATGKHERRAWRHDLSLLLGRLPDQVRSPIPGATWRRPEPAAPAPIRPARIYTCPMHPRDPPGRAGQLPDLRHGAGA
jgi:Cu+-exporting ATPase